MGDVRKTYGQHFCASEQGYCQCLEPRLGNVAHGREQLPYHREAEEG